VEADVALVLAIDGINLFSQRRSNRRCAVWVSAVHRCAVLQHRSSFTADRDNTMYNQAAINAYILSLD
jgi:hypothetical protein